MSYILQFLAGVLLTNAVPHLVQGLSGAAFQSPFAKPPGVGESSAIVNVWWGFANLVGGAALLAHFRPDGVVGWGLVSVGSLLVGSLNARHFGAVRAKKAS